MVFIIYRRNIAWLPKRKWKHYGNEVDEQSFITEQRRNHDTSRVEIFFHKNAT